MGKSDVPLNVNVTETAAWIQVIMGGFSLKVDEMGSLARVQEQYTKNYFLFFFVLRMFV